MRRLLKYKVPQFDAKAEADKVFTGLRLPVTILLTSLYGDNFIPFGMGPAMGPDGKLAITLPMAQRTREIGVRMALGATPGGIARMVLGRAACSIAAGAALGVVGSLLAARLLKAVLFQVSARDPLVLTGALAVLAGTVLLAAWIPARRAARVDPMEALRQE